METKNCVECGAELPPEHGKSDLCIDCAVERMAENNRQLREKKGPLYEKWKEGIKRSLE